MPDKPDKTHTTNYFNTFIEVADDTKASSGIKPSSKSGTTTVAEMQYDLIANIPYRYTSDDVLFLTYAHQNDLNEADYETHRQEFFSKGRA